MLNIDNVFCLLDVCMSSAESGEVMRCFASWAHLPLVRSQQLSNCAVLGSVFEALVSHQTSGELHETACDTLCSLIQAVVDSQKVKRSHEMRCFEEELAANVHRLQAAYRQSVADGDDRRCKRFCRIFTEMSEAVLPRVMTSKVLNKYDLMRLIDVVLECTGHKSYDVAQGTFGFWHKLSDDLLGTNCARNFRPYFEKLINILHGHCHMRDGVSVGDQDFSQFRSSIEKLVLDIGNYIEPVATFRYLSFKVNSSSDAEWQVAEASLFMMQALTEEMGQSRRQDTDAGVPYVAQCVLEELLPRLATAHPAVAKTLLLLLGKLSRWMGHTFAADGGKSPLIERLLTTVVQLMQQAVLSGPAIKCFEMVCRNLSQHLAPYFGSRFTAADGRGVGVNDQRFRPADRWSRPSYQLSSSVHSLASR